ncbi:MAG: copper transporter, partial [Thermoleophilaceae bacterium]|nr:copper transporter [Thermoleophilaceae bacterium]
LKKADDFLDAAFPQVVDGRLAGQRIALMGSSGSTRDVVNEVRRSVSDAGAKLVYVGELARKPDLEAIGEAVGVTVDDITSANGVATAERLGRSVGRRVARGRASRGLLRLTFGRFSGEFSRTRSDVYAHLPQRAGQAPISGTDQKTADAFERGFVRGLSLVQRRVVGVERSDTNPSSVRWYRALGLSTVDNVDRYAGKYALVLTLDGATGDYGYKKTADAVIPPVAP